jgi:hypothetical protein
LDRCAQAIFGCLFASVCKVAGLSPGRTSDPPHDGHGWRRPAPEPGRIELDLDLLESHRRSSVAMSRAGTIENRDGPDMNFCPISVSFE